jgi:glycosyltransferase involved in cell wall biosynthesis
MVNVSVVIPLYNKVRHIRRAIESVLAQTRGPLELIVVDDGSTDGSGTVVREIIDSRLRLITQPNAGECAARNRGIQAASGELIAFLDADDEWLPEFLKTVLALRAKYPDAGMYATAFLFCNGAKTWRPVYAHCVETPQGGLLRDYFHAGLGSSPVITSSSVMIPSHIIREAGLFPVGVTRGGDLQTWSRIALRYRVAWSPTDGAIYHLAADNRVCNRVLTIPDVAEATVIEEFLQSGREAVSSRQMVKEYLISRRLPRALYFHLNGERKWAISLLKKTRGTTMFRNRRLILWCVVWIPPLLLKSAIAMKQLLRRLLVLRTSSSSLS